MSGPPFSSSFYQAWGDGEGKTGCAQNRGRSRSKAAAADERKKKANAGAGEKEPSEALGKWLPSSTRGHNLEARQAKKPLSPQGVLRWRMPRNKVVPALAGDERVAHQQFFGLLFFYGCRLYHFTPNAILRIANFITVCKCYHGTAPHFEVFRCLLQQCLGGCNDRRKAPCPLRWW